MYSFNSRKNTLETNRFPKNQLGNLYEHIIKIITIFKTKTTYSMIYTLEQSFYLSIFF